MSKKFWQLAVITAAALTPSYSVVADEVAVQGCVERALHSDDSDLRRPALAIQLCSSTEDADAPVDCYLKGRSLSGSDVQLTANQAVILCAGTSHGDAPVDCFARGIQSEGLYRSRAFPLCTGAESADESLYCYANGQTFRGNAISPSYTMQLCQRTEDSRATLECMRNAESLPINIVQAIAMCATPR